MESVFGGDFVRSEAPINVAQADNTTSESEPDLIVTKESMRDSMANPEPEDLTCVIEVSDTTLWYDLHVKASLYARAGIVEYWVINIPDRKVIVHTIPSNGAYKKLLIFDFADAIPVAAGLDICLDEL